MKKSRLHRTPRQKSGSRAHALLATSFVVTFSAGSAACRKKPIDPPDPNDDRESTSVYRAPYGEGCLRSVSVRCPKGVYCNPPGPVEVDCPPELRDASADPPPITRRPPGKEDWLRVTPQLWFVSDKEGCSYQPEYFCAPPNSTSSECTKFPERVKVRCNFGSDAGPKRFEEFVYKDGLGQCRKVPATECAPTPRGRCVVPDGEVVPCTSANDGGNP